MSEEKKDGKKKEKSLIDKIRALISDEDSDKGEGTGGRKRERSVMDAVDAAVEGANEDAKRRK